LFADLALARGDGRYARIQRALGGVQLLILDDWAHCVPLTCDRRERKVRMHSFARSRARGSRYSSPPRIEAGSLPFSLTHWPAAPLSGLTASRKHHCRAFAAYGAHGTAWALGRPLRV
jgi:hypothetical protein